MKSTPSPLTGSLARLITSALWGFAFVAQKTAMEHFGPFMLSALQVVAWGRPVCFYYCAGLAGIN